MIARASIQPISINHLSVSMKDNDGAIQFGDPEPNPDMDNPLEQRYCLASFIPSVQDVISLRLDQDDKVDPFKDPAGESKLMTLLARINRHLFGGSGIGKGVIYGFNWKGHPFQNTSEAVAYSSLLFTPFQVINGEPDCYKARILVEPDSVFESIGLPAGYGTLASWKDHGQVRFLIDKGSIGKGVAVSLKTLAAIGIDIPSHWGNYDLVVCQSDLKIGVADTGVYDGYFGVTNVNPVTIHGQKVSLGFEFWQFLHLDQDVLTMLKDYLIQSKLPDYRTMISTIENQRRFAAYLNNQPYEPLEIHSILEEALHVLGHQYPWVAEHLEPVISNYMLNRRFPGTEYRMTIVVKDFIDSGYYHDPGNATVIGAKYPITAGIAQLSGNGLKGPFAILKQSTADMLNIDADGDAMFVCHPDRNPIFKSILDKQLIKPLRNLDIQSREKYNLPLTLENIARTAWRIYNSSRQIGNLTTNYYLSEIANDTLGTNIDLSL
ncbi:MAG: hypothetical protein DRP96_13060, partial [Candidatus Neomarinimicrobiota bacterium]